MWKIRSKRTSHARFCINAKEAILEVSWNRSDDYDARNVEY